MKEILALALCFSLTSCREPAKKAVPHLVEQLASSEVKVRNQAALDLAPYGSEAADAVPALIKRLQDPNTGVRSSAAYALRKIGTPEANAALDAYKK
ncbi:MAG: HEAT repeat domain-containing protein [Bdellovibrionota bacterium]